MPQRLPGRVAIGHARYSTQGASVLRNVQPLFADVRGGGIALAHNGNLTNARVLREELVSHGAIFQSTSDSEVVLHLAAQSKKTKLTNRVLQALKQVQGAFAFVALVNDRLIAARDPYGIRPLVMGSLGDAVIFASETCALDMVGATFIRVVPPLALALFPGRGDQWVELAGFDVKALVEQPFPQSIGGYDQISEIGLLDELREDSRAVRQVRNTLRGD
ncbi:class II glutamine amidotransferase [uncultured Parasphingopyxis sp.]|uniref:class II glutamine amidotransferase n=1 Tax=uncultured Parasphingopyxis sp. TaxID=1547918 RepID=UPI002624576A|nr:class II glutamine amidotransferase [uncultured Parasphingopyxis sp.]